MKRAIVGVALLVVGCIGAIDPFDPEVGAPTSARCDDADSDPDTDVSYAMHIAPLIRGEVMGTPGCSCHLPTSATPIGLEQTGLDLSTIDGIRAGGGRSRGTAAIPGQPCSSLIVQKIGPAPPVGARMPFNGPPYLSAETQQLIADWIAEGALEN